MKINYVAGAITFSIAAFVGVLGTIHANSSLALIQETQFLTASRIPAAIRQKIDFSQLEGSELVLASQKRLLTAARVILQDDQLGIELGHFVMRGEFGHSQLACDYYDQVKMTFSAEGIATSGEIPQMEIEAPCHAGTDMTRIEAVWIPVAKIQAERAADMDLSYDSDKVKFHFSNMGTEWPTRWSLRSLKLLNTQQDAKEVVIEQKEMREILHKPFVLNWQMAK